jgi:hypothetical protein
VVCAHATSQSPPRSRPEAEGIASQVNFEFVEAADKNLHSFDSFMILRHGKVIAEGWWKPDSAEIPHILNSVNKNFTSTVFISAWLAFRFATDLSLTGTQWHPKRHQLPYYRITTRIQTRHSPNSGRRSLL